MSEKSLVLAHFVLVNVSGHVDSLDSASQNQFQFFSRVICRMEMLSTLISLKFCHFVNCKAIIIAWLKTDLGCAAGIEEETMPECMQTEILSTVGDDDTTILESGVNLNATQSVDDSKTNSSGNLSNMSMLWNRSILAKPTVVPVS